MNLDPEKLEEHVTILEHIEAMDYNLRLDPNIGVSGERYPSGVVWMVLRYSGNQPYVTTDEVGGPFSDVFDAIDYALAFSAKETAEWWRGFATRPGEPFGEEVTEVAREHDADSRHLAVTLNCALVHQNFPGADFATVWSAVQARRQRDMAQTDRAGCP